MSSSRSSCCSRRAAVPSSDPRTGGRGSCGRRDGCSHAGRDVRVDDIVAISVTSQWSGTVPVDRDGMPLHDAIIWMDSRGAPQIRDLVGGRLKVAGYDPRKLRTFIRLTGGAPAHSGKDPIAHILWLQARAPRHRAATYQVPRAQGLAEPQAHRVAPRRRTTRSSCTGSPTTATSRASTTCPSCWRSRASTAPSFPI